MECRLIEPVEYYLKDNEIITWTSPIFQDKFDNQPLGDGTDDIIVENSINLISDTLVDGTSINLVCNTLVVLNSIGIISGNKPLTVELTCTEIIIDNGILSTEYGTIKLTCDVINIYSGGELNFSGGTSEVNCENISVKENSTINFVNNSNATIDCEEFTNGSWCVIRDYEIN